MSDNNETHIEFMGARDAVAKFLLPGDRAANGAEVYEDDVMALQINEDDGDGIAIVGEPGAIRSFAMKMIRATVLAELKIAENKKKAKK